MRAFVTHNQDGNITSIVVPATDLEEGDVELVEASGSDGETVRIAEVEIGSADLAEVRRHHKFDGKTGKLVRK